MVDAVATDKPVSNLPGVASSPPPGNTAEAPRDKTKPKDKASGKSKSHATDKAAEKSRAKSSSHKGQPFLGGTAHDEH